MSIDLTAPICYWDRTLTTDRIWLSFFCLHLAQAKHAAFAAKRNQHYGNEAEAMKIAAALAAQDEDEDEDEGEDEPVPRIATVANGTATR